jgi:hypothetical protein
MWAIVYIGPIDTVYKLNGAIVATGAIHDHCPAMASAMPWNVWLRSFQRFALGGIFQIRCSRPSTMSVGVSRGKFLSHRQVRLVSPCPNCHGCIVWSGLRICELMMKPGFRLRFCLLARPTITGQNPMQLVVYRPLVSL